MKQSNRVYIFGYGSLMWWPGFEYRESFAALLVGYRRSFCRRSVRHRGTWEKPGMVAGLVEGGQCQGEAFGIAPEQESAVLAYLDEREGDGYLRRAVEIEVCADRRLLTAWTYIANANHPTYAADLDLEQKALLLKQGHGESGPALEYLRQLFVNLNQQGIHDPEIQDLALRTGLLVKHESSD